MFLNREAARSLLQAQHQLMQMLMVIQLVIPAMQTVPIELHTVRPHQGPHPCMRLTDFDKPGTDREVIGL